MKELEIRELFRNTQAYGDQEVLVHGWVRSNRSSNQFGFLSINDGSFFNSVQVVYEADKLANYQEVAKFRLSAGVTVRGVVVLTPEAKQPFEIKAEEIILEADSDPDYPLQKKRHTMEFLREIAHLRPRSNTFSAVFRVRSVTAYAIHKFFQEKNFIYVHSPEITCSDCEGAGEMFQVTTLDLDNLPRDEEGRIDYSKDFFGKKAGLTVSGQHEGEIMALAFRNIYTFGPTFRAENSNTQRHAAEFWMIEPEMAFFDLIDDMDTAEAMIKFVVKKLLERCPDELAFFNSFYDKTLLERLNNLVTSDFERITYTEAMKYLEANHDNFEFKAYWGCDLQTEHERYITEKIFKTPVFVMNYPKDITAFYMRLTADGKTVAAVDMLV
ncbi:MAG: asparagine--tRNA ligase, partial [Mogibacterium sp.]|nr:asparagine--tRNA ligase [Mogibacterium sp.]